MPRRTDAAPTELDATARKVWRTARAQLERQGTWQDGDAELLAAYCLALQTARQARARIAKRLKAEGEEAAFFSRGSQRQLVSHPDVQLARQAEGDAANYADKLILTASARRRAGLIGEQTIEDEFASLLKESR